MRRLTCRCKPDRAAGPAVGLLAAFLVVTGAAPDGREHRASETGQDQHVTETNAACCRRSMACPRTLELAAEKGQRGENAHDNIRNH